MPTTDSNEELLNNLVEMSSLVEETGDVVYREFDIDALISFIIADREAAIREAEDNFSLAAAIVMHRPERIKLWETYIDLTGSTNAKERLEYEIKEGKRIASLNQPTKEETL